jgi:murein L,D-transpeptidase YcbB/YkuD
MPRPTCRFLAFIALTSIYLLPLLPTPVLAALAFSDHLRHRIASQLQASTTDRLRTALLALNRVYRSLGYQPVWIAETGPGEEAWVLLEIFSNAAQHGLRPDDYRVGQIRHLMSRADDDVSRAELELRLSASFLQYAGDIASGRLDPRALDAEYLMVPRQADLEAIMREATTATNIKTLLSLLEPSSADYKRLQQALAKYRAIAQSGGWPQVPIGENLVLGTTDARIEALRERLRAERDLLPLYDTAARGGDPKYFDRALDDAVKWFQRRHGLQVDGVVGKQTLAALNIPVRQRIEQIRVNLERLRWLKEDLAKPYILVNLADFSLHVVDRTGPVFFDRVVVGSPNRRTPVFQADMTHIVINPYWHVPPSIAGDEILPLIQNDIGYLEHRGFNVLSDWTGDAVEVDPQSIDWPSLTASTLPYKFRQQPGMHNALGRIKFSLPNSSGIYLHDTPMRGLFHRTLRAFSHGCIRVQHPEELALAVLADEADWTMRKLQQVIATGAPRVLYLPAPVPVRVIYLTAWVEEDGTIHFRRDVYGRDRLVAAALRCFPGEVRAADYALP